MKKERKKERKKKKEEGKKERMKDRKLHRHFLCKLFGNIPTVMNNPYPVLKKTPTIFRGFYNSLKLYYIKDEVHFFNQVLKLPINLSLSKVPNGKFPIPGIFTSNEE